ncbi:MAG: heat-inducible transcription repressor HrcA [Clostridia bacterium]|nr:heat-inducible transcription repressor HrcA [Clostridia bacterium]
MLDDRKKSILKAIIEEYINTAEPVSSLSLVEKYELNFSSATIRNEMAELEHEGYLEKPHTSAGRIPSVKGYRFYVDELLNDENISLEEIQYIKENLQMKVNEIEDLTKITTNTISEMTHYTTVAIGPDSTNNVIKDIKFILLGERLLMAVILTENGAVKETIIKYDEDISNSQINDLNVTFNNKLRGKPLEKIDKPMEEYILSTMKDQAKVIKPIIKQMNKTIEETNKIYLEGTSKVFDFPEFSRIDTAKNFLSILDTKEEMLEILNSGLAKDINVYIGDENENKDLKDLSIITFKHKVGNKDMGTIGIIGPKRMNYSKVISIMKYISKRLNENNDKN